MVLDIEYGREEWLSDSAAAYAEAERRIARTAAAEDPEDRKAIWFGDLAALETIPPGLEKVEGLKEVYCGWSKTPDGLRFFSNDVCQLWDITALAEVRLLDVVDLSRTNVVDISPLSKRWALREFRAFDTRIESIEAFETVRLQKVDLSFTDVRDLSPLKKSEALQGLYAGGTDVSNIIPLFEMKKLTDLVISHSKFADAKQLLELPRLALGSPRTLDIRETPAVKNDRDLAEAANTKDRAAQAERVYSYLKGLDWRKSAPQLDTEPYRMEEPAARLVEAGAVALAVEEGIARAFDRLGPSGPRLRPGSDYAERLEALQEEAAAVFADASSPERAGQVPAGLVGWLEDFERATRREPPKWFSLRGRARPIRGELRENRKQLEEQIRAGFLVRLDGMLADLDELAPYLTPPKDIAEEREQLIDDLADLLDDLDGRLGEVLERLAQLEDDFSSMRGREVADESPAEAARVLREEIAAAQASDVPKPRKKRMLAAALASAAGVAGGVGAIAKALRDGEAVGDALQSFLESEAGQGLQTEARELLELIASLFG